MVNVVNGEKVDFLKNSSTDYLKEVLIKSSKNLGLGECDFSIEHPVNLNFGDYFSNIALILAKTDPEKGLNAKEIAEKIKIEIDKMLVSETSPKILEKVEVAGPGFLNFFLTDNFFIEKILEIVKSNNSFKKDFIGNGKYGQNNKLIGKKILMDYTDPNPFKVFHIGHLMSNAIGESLSRIFEYSGAEVVRANYQGDVGLHVAKAIWGILKLRENNVSYNNLIGNKDKVDEGISFIGEAYVLGSDKYENDEVVKGEIDKLNATIFKRENEDINRIYDWGKDISLQHFEKIYQKLGTKFDKYYFESEVADDGLKISYDALKNGIFEKNENAVIFRGENYGLHTRVFVNSNNLPTYEAKELGLNYKKYKDYKPDISIMVTATEQDAFFSVVLKALEIIYPEISAITKHISHGMLRFKSGKMSSRKGNVITGESLMEDVEELVKEKIKDRDYEQKEKEDVINKVAIGAIKYSILKQKAGGDIIFDFEKSISFDGDSGPYLQYSAVRANSVIKKAEKEGIDISSSEGNFKNKVGTLEKLLYRYPEIIERSLNEYEPHHLATYLVDLAGAFNSFYAKEQIISQDKNDKESLELTKYRLLLVSAFYTIIQSGLNVLGISVPEKM